MTVRVVVVLLTAESVKGRAVLLLLIQPSMLIASHLAALLQAGSGNLSGTATGYPEQVRQAAEGLKGAAARGGAPVSSFLDGRVYPALQQHVNTAGTGPAAPSCDSGHAQIMAGPYA